MLTISIIHCIFLPHFISNQQFKTSLVFQTLFQINTKSVVQTLSTVYFHGLTILVTEFILICEPESKIRPQIAEKKKHPSTVQEATHPQYKRLNH